MWPGCGKSFVVKDEWIGMEMHCPAEGRGQAHKFNSFVCDWQGLPVPPVPPAVEHARQDMRLRSKYSPEDADREAEKNILRQLRYQERLKEWNTLPLYKQIITKKPTREAD
jgi:hypothetical protein